MKEKLGRKRKKGEKKSKNVRSKGKKLRETVNDVGEEMTEERDKRMEESETRKNKDKSGGKKLTVNGKKRKKLNHLQATRQDRLKVGEDGADLQCPVCHKIFVKKTSLDGHVWVHFRKRPWQCRYCKKGFSN